ncbi:MAG: hypothetical protein ACFWT4_05895 [Citrobacter braakii]
MLADPQYDLVVLDELTYMLAYHYLDTRRLSAPSKIALRSKASS